MEHEIQLEPNNQPFQIEAEIVLHGTTLTVFGDINRIREDILNEAKRRADSGVEIDLDKLEHILVNMPVFFDREAFNKYFETKTGFSQNDGKSRVGGLAIRNINFPAIYLNAKSLARSVDTELPDSPVEVRKEMFMELLRIVYMHERDHVLRAFTLAYNNEDIPRYIEMRQIQFLAIHATLITELSIILAKYYRPNEIYSIEKMKEIIDNMIYSIAIAYSFGANVGQEIHYRYVDEVEKAARAQEHHGQSSSGLFRFSER